MDDPLSRNFSWLTDAVTIPISDLEQVLFQTPAIHQFLNSESQFFVSASRGFGKTLLLKSRRARLMLDHTIPRTRSADVLFLPRDRPYLDSMHGEMPPLSNTQQAFLSILRNCRRLWSYALRVSVLSHFSKALDSLDVSMFTEYSAQPLRHVISERASATLIFRHLLSMTETKLNRLLDLTDREIAIAFRRIHSGVFMFIDQIDGGIHNLPQEAWIHMQAGLLEAASDVMASNNHVRIYASIREEAFDNYSSINKPKISAATLKVGYTFEEQRQIIDHLSQFYEQKAGFHSFAGRSSISNLAGRVVEDSFRYVHRHTVGRPRDLVIMCSEISRAGNDLSEQQFLKTVNQTGAGAVLPAVFFELGVFLVYLRDETERNRFMDLLPTNILTGMEIESICRAFFGCEDISDWRRHADEIRISNPFCELYCCGLIGTVCEDPLSGQMVHQFSQPADAIKRGQRGLPTADYYVIHPSLDVMLRSRAAEDGYQSLEYVTVGNGNLWRHYDSALIDQQKATQKIRSDALRRDVLGCVESVLSETGDFDHLSTLNSLPVDEVLLKLQEQGYEDVWLHLDQLIDVIRRHADDSTR